MKRPSQKELEQFFFDSMKPVPPPGRIIKEDQVVCNHEPHFHYDERGFAVKCYHNCVSLFSNWRFWAGLTLGFPLEHVLWEKVWPFYLITDLLLK